MDKKRKKQRITSVRTGVSPTPERRLQNGGVVKEVTDRDVKGNVLVYRFKAKAECPVDVYFQRQKLSLAETEAATKFRHAYLRAVLKVRVDDVGAGSGGDREAAFLSYTYSEQLVREAASAVSSAQWAIIVSICGHDEWAGDSYRFQTFRRGLEKLVELWKIA